MTADGKIPANSCLLSAADGRMIIITLLQAHIMIQKIQFPRLTVTGRMTAPIGVVCALAAALVAQAGVSEASAATLNGTFGFSPVELGTSEPLASFAGTTLSSATSLTFAKATPLPIVSLPFVQNVVTTYLSGTKYLGKNNDFDSVDHPSPFAVALQSIVTLNAADLTLSVTNLNGGYTPDPIANFLTFSAGGLPSLFGTPKGTTPPNRFVYDISLVNWTSSVLNPDHLDFSSIGTLHDTLGQFASNDAVLKFSANLACDPLFGPCSGTDSGINVAWSFATVGSGGSSLIPEPAGLALLGLGLVALAAARRRA